MLEDVTALKWLGRRRELWIRQVLIGSWLRKLNPLLAAAAWLWRRLMWRTTFIAITGSLGKTTSKELLASILRAHASTFWTVGNQNGSSLVVLNILRVRPWHRYAVLEVAGAAPGMMQRIAPIVRPDVALILAIRRTHSTAFASLDEHAREKAYLLRATSPHGTIVLCEDDPRVSAMLPGAGQRVVRYGSAPTSHLKAWNISAQWPARLTFEVQHEGQTLSVKTQLVGEHWLPTALGALAAAASLGIPLDSAARSVAAVPPFRGRLQPVLLPNGAIVLRDDYNASLDGTEASIQVMRQARAQRRILVLSDISDFGANRKKRLRYIAAAIPEFAEMAVFVGESIDYAIRRAVEAGLPPDRVFGFSTLLETADFLRKELRARDLVLLKGRTTDHIARVFFAQFASVSCWKSHCPKTMLCDECWELGVVSNDLRKVEIVAPASPH